MSDLLVVDLVAVRRVFDLVAVAWLWHHGRLCIVIALTITIHTALVLLGTSAMLIVPDIAHHTPPPYCRHDTICVDRDQSYAFIIVTDTVSIINFAGTVVMTLTVMCYSHDHHLHEHHRRNKHCCSYTFNISYRIGLQP